MVGVQEQGGGGRPPVIEGEHDRVARCGVPGKRDGIVGVRLHDPENLDRQPYFVFAVLWPTAKVPAERSARA
jgi:hypothetical protein